MNIYLEFSTGPFCKPFFFKSTINTRFGIGWFAISIDKYTMKEQIERAEKGLLGWTD